MTDSKIRHDATVAISILSQLGIKVTLNDPYVLSIQNVTQDGKPLKLTVQQAQGLAESFPAIVAAVGIDL